MNWKCGGRSPKREPRENPCPHRRNSHRDYETRTASFKSAKCGGFGMGRFPVTLYKEQWLKLLDMSDEIRAFISANEAQLKAKD